jgi:hypothetical protein
MIISGLGSGVRPRRGTQVMTYSTKHNDHRSRASASRAARMAQLQKHCEHAQRRVDHYRAMVERFKWSGWDTRAALDVLETHQHSLDFYRDELETMRALSDEEFRARLRSVSGGPAAPSRR